jgi:aspartate carbamoyltransferase catalytic subunit
VTFIWNPSDGWGEHPTQILTDLYTIQREKGRIDGLKWVAVGDMRMRTMHSLGHALTQFDCPITFISPKDMSLPDEYREDFKRNSLNFTEGDDVRKVIADADVILVEPVVQPDYTKSRDERDGDVGLTPPEFKITKELLETKAKSDAVLLHSLPRMDEIPPDVDQTRWARYWQEGFNGVVMRMALLALVLGEME